jgi:GT2 family glycosyltransferase
MAIALSHYNSRSQRRLDLIERSLAEFKAGQFYQAYVLADISCRADVPAPEDLLLRSEIAARLGFDDLAFADLSEAFAIDPSMPSAQLRMLAALQRQGKVVEADVMARAFLRVHPHPKVIVAAIAALQRDDSAQAVALVQADRASIKLHIFSVTQQAFHLTVAFENHAERVLVQTAVNHPLGSALGAAASFEIAWPESDWTVKFASDPPLDWTGPPAFRPFHPWRPSHRRQPGLRPGPECPVGVIIPVHSSVALTRACLDSVIASRSELPQRIIIVDDCGPDPDLRAMLIDYALLPGVELITNPINLGFIGSVNRALMYMPDGDVVLLNADTVVAPGWLERLSRAAYSRAKIGTVTPLSNNGELTSVPVPFDSMTLPTIENIGAIDATVARLNAGKTIDLPSGVGFCLYITDVCRRRTGLLNDVDYEEGYLEEVDFCLRAIEAGFTHVCACDVFVGHAGSQSFQGRKRGLVKHNMAQLERFFPSSGAMTHRFIQGDPLADVRSAMQRRLLSAGIGLANAVTLVIGRDAVVAVDDPDLPCLKALAPNELLLRLSFTAAPQSSAILHLDEAMAPHRLSLKLASADPAVELLDAIAACEITRVLYLDAHHPDWARRLPALLGVPYDVNAVDDSVLSACRRQNFDQPEAGDRSQWPPFLQQARRFVTSSSRLARLLSDLGVRRPVVEVSDWSTPFSRVDAVAPVHHNTVAVLVDEYDSSAWKVLHQLARRIVSEKLDVTLVVFGRTIDDDALRRTGRVTVTGIPKLEFLHTAFGLHGCCATLALIPRGSCQHPSLGAIARGPKPILTWNPYLQDVLGCSEGDCMTFEAEGSVEALVLALRAIRRSGHGPQ